MDQQHTLVFVTVLAAWPGDAQVQKNFKDFFWKQTFKSMQNLAYFDCTHIFLLKKNGKIELSNLVPAPFSPYKTWQVASVDW